LCVKYKKIKNKKISFSRWGGERGREEDKGERGIRGEKGIRSLQKIFLHYTNLLFGVEEGGDGVCPVAHRIDVHGHEVLVGRGSEREGMPLVLRDVPLGSYKTNTKKRKTKQKSGMHVLNFFILIVVYIVNVIWDGIEQVREGKREGGEERIGVIK
jgi:hypothetical protein